MINSLMGASLLALAKSLYYNLSKISFAAICVWVFEKWRELTGPGNVTRNFLKMEIRAIKLYNCAAANIQNRLGLQQNVAQRRKGNIWSRFYDNLASVLSLRNCFFTCTFPSTEFKYTRKTLINIHDSQDIWKISEWCIVPQKSTHYLSNRKRFPCTHSLI